MTSGKRSASRRVRIGCGAGFANDRIEPARDLAERGALDYLFFECLAERTLAQSHLARRKDSAAGFNPFLVRRLEAVLSACRTHGTRIITNMGAANPLGAGHAALAVARKLGHDGLKVAVIEGDDVTAQLRPDTIFQECGRSLSQMETPLIQANAYLGAGPIAEALAQGADIVITGRCADPSLVLGPLIHEFGWAADDWDRLGAGTLVGHLLECGFQITGGYFADPGRKEVPGLAWLGYPLAEVDSDGGAVITKLPGTGGCVTRETVLEQMLYEVHDPGAYLTPDVTADFSAITVRDQGADRVAASGAKGRAQPDTLKVTAGFEGGYLAEAGISYAGPGAVARARLAGEVLRERMVKVHGCDVPLRLDLIGVNALHATARPEHDAPDTRDVRLRAALRTRDEHMAETLVNEVETLWIAGPAGGGGMRGRITPSVMTRSALIPRSLVQPSITMLVA